MMRGSGCREERALSAMILASRFSTVKVRQGSHAKEGLFLGSSKTQ
jgi:hypothetical protein